jgi:hypothetical protein
MDSVKQRWKRRAWFAVIALALSLAGSLVSSSCIVIDAVFDAEPPDCLCGCTDDYGMEYLQGLDLPEGVCSADDCAIECFNDLCSVAGGRCAEL